MGTKCVPTYATLVLGFLEENMYDATEENFSREFREYFEKGWCRFLDDCFIIMNGNIQELNKLHVILISLQQCIKFTMEYNRKHLPFLNKTVISKEGNIETVIYFKKTDSQQYLSNIAHPVLSTTITVTAKVASDIRYM